MEKTESNNKITYAIIWLAICVITLLPARCYNGFYVHFFAVDSNISVQYVNLVDLAVLLTTVVCLVHQHQIKKYPAISWFVGVYFFSRVFFLMLLPFFGYAEFMGEILSKTAIVCCAAIIAVISDEATDFQKSIVYYLALFILVAASFFLIGYGGYGRMNRTGSIGFGTNETASFACALLVISLFINFMPIWARIIVSVVSIACVLNVASRRGLIISIVILIVWVLSKIFKRKNRFVQRRNFFTTIAIIIAAVLILYINRFRIIDYINDSALMTRINFTERQNQEVFDFSDRTLIYKAAFNFISSHPFFGTFGCDLIFAQGSASHAHSIFLQPLVTNGAFIGLFFDVYLIFSLVRSIQLLYIYSKDKSHYFPAIVSVFYIVYLVFDSFGYLLWNPKGLFWIVLSTFFIHIEYYQFKYSDEENLLI
jgi:O-antigen ligase